jgi:hypothetical protein
MDFQTLAIPCHSRSVCSASMNNLEQRQKAMRFQMQNKRGYRKREIPQQPLTCEELGRQLMRQFQDKFFSIVYDIGKFELMKRLPENATWHDVFKTIEEYISEMERQKP